MTYSPHIRPAPEDDHGSGRDPIKHCNPLAAAEAAERMAVETLRATESLCSDVAALTVRHATIAVKLYEKLENNEHTSMDHLLAFFSDASYRAKILELIATAETTTTGSCTPGLSVRADWLPEDTLAFFKHVFYGAWTEAVRAQNIATAANALTLGMHREIMRGGD